MWKDQQFKRYKGLACENPIHPWLHCTGLHPFYDHQLLSLSLQICDSFIMDFPLGMVLFCFLALCREITCDAQHVGWFCGG